MEVRLSTREDGEWIVTAILHDEEVRKRLGGLGIWIVWLDACRGMSREQALDYVRRLNPHLVVQ